VELSGYSGSYTPISNYLFYPVQVIPNPIQLISCDMNYSRHTVENNDQIRFCSDVCKECSHITTRRTTALTPTCSSCIENSEFQSQTCSCSVGYVFNLPSNRCKPPNILRCLTLNERIECLECEIGYIVGCLGDCCVCAEGYYRLVENPIECI